MASDRPLAVDALDIWQAGVDAVRPSRLFADRVSFEANCLCVDNVEVDLSKVGRLVIVGAGKAAAAMCVALDQSVLSPLRAAFPKLEIVGWLNCPADTVNCEVQGITLHAARPAGVNSPTTEGVSGTKQILRLLETCGKDDLVLCLISGGGSALLVAPRSGISLEDKQAVAKYVAAGGGNIDQLNTIRRCLSEVKGGGLARRCKAGRLISIVISDVLGDPLDVIASGPTFLDQIASTSKALDVLRELEILERPELESVVRYLRSQRDQKAVAIDSKSLPKVDHVVLGNNATAVDAAGIRAVELGYRYIMQAGTKAEGDVMVLAQQISQGIDQLRREAEIDCWITGGEPTVKLPADFHGKGGRNQQLALAVMQGLQNRGWPLDGLADVAFVSGGTDGEDGPTNAAGGFIDKDVLRKGKSLGLEFSDFLARADAYPYLDATGGLIRTGPTGTNVCDLRVALTSTSRKGP